MTDSDFGKLAIILGVIALIGVILVAIFGWAILIMPAVIAIAFTFGGPAFGGVALLGVGITTIIFFNWGFAGWICLAISAFIWTFMIGAIAGHWDGFNEGHEAGIFSALDGTWED